MQIDLQVLSARTVNELLLEAPATVSVFNAFGIDSCCGGDETVAASAERDGAPLDALLLALASQLEAR